ncbi:UNVERIFIED_CONTAM: 3-deoxy-manno-octulosonate cytidylyltransferase, mitochondrial [Sesamum radiatum]|uniref:3-deoxy-manno-octulosonate cytidylyltransferase n=1 Tax=Sesamum radiatum TaxID=300843 RepID=A0AAW2K398_SESRA
MQLTDPSSSSTPSSTRSWIVHGLAAGVAAAVAFGAQAYLFSRRSAKFRCRVIGIIPARFASSRFQGKPLVHILGKPMIQRTWERAKMATLLDHVVVATDDDKIAACCNGFGAEVVMTSESCRNGTERCNEALQKLGKKYDVVVNIQGDEPLIEPEIIDGIVKALQAAPDAVFSTAVTSLKPEDACDPNRVKCVVDNRGYAIYFSRGLIPFNKSGNVNPRFPYLLHLGIQSYDAKFLKIYPELPPTPLQMEEDLEQLKVLENGYKMKVIKVDHESHGVDVPEDVDKIEHYMRQRNLCYPFPSHGWSAGNPNYPTCLRSSVRLLGSVAGSCSARFSEFRGLKIQPTRSSAKLRSTSKLARRGSRIVCEAQDTATEVPAVTDSGWQSSVLESDLPVLVEFWAPWCGPCKMIHPVIDKLAKQYAGKLKCYKVNTDESPSIATQYGIRSIPTVIIFKNGEKKDAVIGAVPESTLTSSIEKFL